LHMRRRGLTEVQYQVMLLRGRGLTQADTAKQLKTSRANVSMIELRALRRVAEARKTLDAYQSTLVEHSVRIPKGTRFYEVPAMVLKEGDRWGIHLQSNLVDIIRMVRQIRPTCLEDGRTTRALSFTFNPAGRLRVGSSRR
jgi:HTH-type transcriptional regulator, fmd operon transcriptional regulator